MAAAGLYTFGGSFWEFGEPDWEHTQYFLMFGVAEDHASNPIKIGLGKLKKRGVKIVSVNPVRTGYSAIADEWIGIRPGTDGLFAGCADPRAAAHRSKIDLDYLVRYTNAPWLVIRDSRRAPTTACSPATPPATRWCTTRRRASSSSAPVADIDAGAVRQRSACPMAARRCRCSS